MSNVQLSQAKAAIDPEFVRRAVKEASINALRIALYHQTKDPELAAMRVHEHAVRGGALKSIVVAREHHDTIREKAFDWLMSAKPAVAYPDRQEAAELMTLFSGHAPSSSEAAYGFEDLGFEPFPRLARWKKRPDDQLLDSMKVTIIGAGVSAIAAAVQLNHLGIPYRIIDRYNGIGGTWMANDYPGARVDVSTFLYQFKFDSGYKWKSYFATQAELKEYLEYIVDKYDIRKHIDLNTELLSATWQERDNQWRLEMRGPDGEIESSNSRFVISAAGLFTTPNMPDIPGIESYEGKMFHTTAWDHDFDYAGKRVAVIGTGSTGSQLTPVIAKTAGHVTVIQRTPNWITPIKDYQANVSEEIQWLMDTLPGYANWYTYSAFLSELPGQGLQVIDPDWVAQGGRVNEMNHQLAESLKAYIRSKVGDGDLYEKLVPPYPPMARRLVIDNGWYDTLLRDNVDLVCGGVKKFTRTGLVCDDGVEREFDLVVMSAGFKVSQYFWPVKYTGTDGQTIEDLWKKDGPRAYKGLTLPGFPNFFVIYGPNAQARAGSFHSWVEILTRHIASLMTDMIEQGETRIEVKREAYEDYNTHMDQRMKSLLWETEGTGGYYVNDQGRSGVNMPWTLQEFYEMVRESDLENYIIGSPTD